MKLLSKLSQGKFHYATSKGKFMFYTDSFDKHDDVKKVLNGDRQVNNCFIVCLIFYYEKREKFSVYSTSCNLFYE